MYSHEEAPQPRDRRAWTDEEDELLRAAIEQEDPDANPPSKWHAIAKHIPNRTNKDCRKRWWAQMATRVSKGSWSTEEDERLFAAVEELGTKWAAVAGRVGTRNSGQCAKRWNDALNPAIDRSSWTPEEDQALLKAVEVQGHSWANIARTYLPGRTGLAAKNRYNHLIRGSSDRSSSRGRRMSAASAMRRRSTRGGSISSLSSAPSPRSTITPPPVRSNASSPGGSGAGTSNLVADGLSLHTPIDLRHTPWPHNLSDGQLLDDVPELAHSGSTSRSSSIYSHSSSPSLESQMLSMFMQNNMGEFFSDPALDPTGLPPLQPNAVGALALDACSPASVISDPMDSWAASHFSYLDFSPTGAHHSHTHAHTHHQHPYDAQLTPSLSTPAMSTASSSSVSSTPQLADPHFVSSSRFSPHVYGGMHDLSAAGMHYLSSPMDHAGERRMASVSAYNVDLSVHDFPHGMNMLGHSMAATA